MVTTSVPIEKEGIMRVESWTGEENSQSTEGDQSDSLLAIVLFPSETLWLAHAFRNFAHWRTNIG
jgi:hypothetical protein